MSKIALLILLLIAAAAPARAQESPPPQEGFTFLDLPFSARSAVLGKAFTAGDDITTTFGNPAAANAEMHNALAFSYVNHLSDYNAGMLAYGRRIPDIGVFTGGIRYLSYGSFEEASSQGQRTGNTFGAGDLALSAALSRRAGERLRYGAAANLLYAHLADEGAMAVAMDVGARYELPAYQLTLSTSLNNIGTTISSLGTTAPALPTDLRIGVKKVLAHLPLALTLTGHHLQRPQLAEHPASTLDAVLHHLSVGGEFRIGSALQLRLGYDHHRHQNLSMGGRIDFAGMGLGFGLALAGFQFDYAYSSWSSLGGLHYLTVRTQL